MEMPRCGNRGNPTSRFHRSHEQRKSQKPRFHSHRRDHDLPSPQSKQPRTKNSPGGRGKVEIQKRDSHFSTTLGAGLRQQVKQDSYKTH